jgi:hypothetical protein
MRSGSWSLPQCQKRQNRRSKALPMWVSTEEINEVGGGVRKAVERDKLREEATILSREEYGHQGHLE